MSATISSAKEESLKNNINPGPMYFSDRQLEIIFDAVEDYAVLVNEDLADECSEIMDTIEAHFSNKNIQ